jgi:hypothetical protein
MSLNQSSIGACAACVAVLLCSCGPHQVGGGGSGAEAGEGASAGSPAAGSGGTSSAGNAGSGGSAVAGSAGASGSGEPGLEPVIGCPAAAWPDAGFYYVPPFNPPLEEIDIRLETFSPRGISADGRVVVGGANDPESVSGRPAPASFTLAGGAVILPAPEPSGEGYALLASCDGSVILEQELFFADIFRAENGRASRVLGDQPATDTLSMDPAGARIVDGTGRSGYNEEEGQLPPVPQEWTAATGAALLTELAGKQLHHVSADGTLIASDPEALFRYDRTTLTRQPIGMAPVWGGSSIAVSADGRAWIQSADTNLDSLLVWRSAAEPRSITCPTTNYCLPIDMSSTGAVALVDVALDSSSGLLSSWLWTERDGLVDLTELFRRFGIDPGSGYKLHAAALSDDARAFAGDVVDPASGRVSFFYAVLPVAAYQ